jgi:ABC-2 type transport system permease protein
VIARAEERSGGFESFVRGAASFAWLEFKTLRYNPSNFILSFVEGAVNTGIWLFIGLFLAGVADRAVAGFGGSYVAFVVIGVAFFETAQTALRSPFESVSLAFWDKRLEAYHLADHGIWAFIVGRLGWQLAYAIAVQGLVLALIIVTVGLDVAPTADLPLAIALFGLFGAGCFGIGLAGASSFFLLEVKEGAEPIGWTVTVLARIASGVYYPLTILPDWLRPLGLIVPHTYALGAIRLVLLDGRGLGDAEVRSDALALLVYATLAIALGVILLRRGIAQAERQGGLSVVG